MSLKMLREDLCRRQVQAPEWPSDIASAVGALINMIDHHRPLATSGKHGDLHTQTCGCDDRPNDHDHPAVTPDPPLGPTFISQHEPDAE